MSLQRNYYEVLGIPPGATTDQIKKKYRELARKFHPDVIQDKVLGQRVFSQINQAYRILADPERREQYNSQLSQQAAASAPPARVAQSNLNQARPAAPAQPTVASRPQPTMPQATSQPQAGATGQRTQRLQPVASPQARPTAPAAQPGATQKEQAMIGLLANASNAIMADKPLEARAFCVKVLEIDPKNVRALEVLGDALVSMGRREDAAVQYRNALKIAPSSMIQSKLNRLEEAATGTRTSPPTAEADKPSGLFGRFMGRK